jgi:hypothetical protein
MELAKVRGRHKNPESPVRKRDKPVGMKEPSSKDYVVDRFGTKWRELEPGEMTQAAYSWLDYGNFDSEGKPKRHYVKRRDKLHASIVAKLLDAVPPSRNKPPVVYFMGGGTAVGKTTFRKRQDSGIPGKSRAITIDSDTIKEHLPEYAAAMKRFKAGNAGPEDHLITSVVHEESSDVAARASRNAVDLNVPRDIVYDGTGDSTPESLRKKVDGLRKRGHVVKATYLTRPLEEAHRNAHVRGEKSGRRVNPKYIDQIHAAVSRTFQSEWSYFDDCELWDMTDVSDTSTKKPVLVARKNKKTGQLDIFDRALWEAFVKKGELPVETVEEYLEEGSDEKTQP